MTFTGREMLSSCLSQPFKNASPFLAQLAVWGRGLSPVPSLPVLRPSGPQASHRERSCPLVVFHGSEIHLGSQKDSQDSWGTLCPASPEVSTHPLGPWSA